MNRVTQYLQAAERDNTRKSYASAVRHFEIEWKGLLPSTADAMARYLADHAATHSINTLRQRLERIEHLTDLVIAEEDLVSLELAIKLHRLRAPTHRDAA